MVLVTLEVHQATVVPGLQELTRRSTVDSTGDAAPDPGRPQSVK
jgi:hypothetical protein